MGNALSILDLLVIDRCRKKVLRNNDINTDADGEQGNNERE